MDKEILKRKVCRIIDENREKICAIGYNIYKRPELGYKEVYANQVVCDTFNELGLKYENGLAITGVKAKLKEVSEGINIAVVGELDAVVCPLHPDADKNSGAAHTCGHFAQIASMLAVAIALEKVKDELDYGNVTFIASPAEECVELEYRQQLIKENKIHYMGGKQEMIHQGVFDDVDMAMMIHGMRVDDHIKATSFGTGFIAKTVKFIGKEAHAGLEPWNGTNALNAASLALMAINSIRETLKHEDCIKIHPIMTKGGTLVNIVPNDVRLEMYIRGANIEAIKDANYKVNRAVKGCAYALGCEVDIIDSPGYLPLVSNMDLGKVFKDNAQLICPETPTLLFKEVEGISTDAGDLSHLIPLIQGGVGGFIHGFHTKDFKIDNEELAYIVPAKILACTIIDLLSNQGEKAKEIKEQFKTNYSMSNYDSIWNEILYSNYD